MASISGSSHCFRWSTTPWGLTSLQPLRGRGGATWECRGNNVLQVNFTVWKHRRWEAANKYIYSSLTPRDTAPGYGISAHLIQSQHMGLRNWLDASVKQQPPSVSTWSNAPPYICFPFLPASQFQFPHSGHLGIVPPNDAIALSFKLLFPRLRQYADISFAIRKERGKHERGGVGVGGGQRRSRGLRGTNC